MSADSDVDGTDRPRLFVPLKNVHYRRFEAGEKDVELRGINNQFNTGTVTEGRRVELRRGYSTDDSLFGAVGDTWTADHVTEIFSVVGVDRIAPGEWRHDALEGINEILGEYDRYIAFEVRLDRHAGDGAVDGEATETVECTVCRDDVGRGPAGLGIRQHASKHRREFLERFGREPRDYEEVRRRLGRPAFHDVDEEQLSLAESVDQRAREARLDDGQAELVNPDQLNPVDDADEDGGSP